MVKILVGPDGDALEVMPDRCRDWVAVDASPEHPVLSTPPYDSTEQRAGRDGGQAQRVRQQGPVEVGVRHTPDMGETQGPRDTRGEDRPVPQAARTSASASTLTRFAGLCPLRVIIGVVADTEEGPLCGQAVP